MRGIIRDILIVILSVFLFIDFYNGSLRLRTLGVGVLLLLTTIWFLLERIGVL